MLNIFRLWIAVFSMWNWGSISGRKPEEHPTEFLAVFFGAMLIETLCAINQSIKDKDTGVVTK